ncbi:hypothetical protein DFH08DRAFT_2625 [Mycena albidolilacea]|uniref:Uncharacterized protein n=1 Tax=Mycena albidolilacea TaxID=1033008 RepID=A0AAD7F619_9AGAR|nr:hypothetical protein DFH08DRAFT_2625 [Mycena albidolilacea]
MCPMRQQEEKTFDVGSNNLTYNERPCDTVDEHDAFIPNIAHRCHRSPSPDIFAIDDRAALVASPKAAILDDPTIDEHDLAEVFTQSIADLSDSPASPNVLLPASKTIIIDEKPRTQGPNAVPAELATSSHSKSPSAHTVTPVVSPNVFLLPAASVMLDGPAACDCAPRRPVRFVLSFASFAPFYVTDTHFQPPRASSRVRTQSAGQVRGAPRSPAPAGAAVRRIAPFSPSSLWDTSPPPSMAEPSVAEPVFTLPMVRAPQSAWDIPGAIIYQTAAPLRPRNTQVICATSDSSTTKAPSWNGRLSQRDAFRSYTTRSRVHLFLLRYGNSSVRFPLPGPAPARCPPALRPRSAAGLVPFASFPPAQTQTRARAYPHANVYFGLAQDRAQGAR